MAIAARLNLKTAELSLYCMIDHLVLFQFRRDVTKQAVEEVFEDLRGLSRDIDGIVAFRGGAYASPEGLNQGFTHGFVMTFDCEASRDAYLPHPAHQQVVDKLIPMLEGGIQGVLAFDCIDGEL